MKRAILTVGLLGMSLWGVDFSQMTTEQLIDMRGTVLVEDRDAYQSEMQSRLSTMTTDERASFTASRQATGLGARTGVVGANQPQFSTIDTNNDGQISVAELESARAARLEANAADGRALQNADNAPDFSAIDANGDGFVSQDEFTAVQATMAANRSANGGGMGLGRGQGQRGANGQGQGQRVRDGSGAGNMHNNMGQRRGK
jgi:hypothetical protein